MILDRLVVEIMGNLKPLKHSLGEATAELGHFAHKSEGLMKGMTMGGALGIAGTVGGLFGMEELFRHSVSEAMDLQGALMRINVTLGESGEKAAEFAEHMLKLGYGKVETINAMERFATLSQQIGVTAEKAEELGEAAVKMAADFSIWKGIDYQEALSAIQMGMMGVTRGLRHYGIMITETDVHQKALTMGLLKQHEAMTDVAKVTASAALLQERMASATGLAEKSLGTARGQGRLLGATMSEIGEKIGMALLPAVNDLTAGINEFVNSIVEGTSEIAPHLSWIGDRFSQLTFGIRHFGTVIKIVQTEWAIAIRKMMDYLEGFSLVCSNLEKVMTAAFSGKKLGKAGWDKLVKDGKDALAEMTGEKESAATRALKADLEHWQKMLGEEWQKEHPEGPPGKGGKGAGGKSPGETLIPEKKAETLDLAGFAKKLQTGVFGKDDAAGRTAKFAEMTAKGVEQLVQQGKQPQPAQPAMAI